MTACKMKTCSKYHNSLHLKTCKFDQKYINKSWILKIHFGVYPVLKWEDCNKKKIDGFQNQFM